MPKTTLASQIETLRSQFDAGGPQKKRAVASELWRLCLENGAAARAALPWLGKLAEDRDKALVTYACEALGRAGEKGRRVLRELLGHRREFVRCKAAYGLSEVGDHTAATLDPLGAMLSARSADERISALRALGKIANYSQRPGLLAPYAKDILAQLDSRDAAVRGWAPDAVVGIFRSRKQFVEFALARFDQSKNRMRHVLLSSLVEQLEHLDARPYLPAILRIIRANNEYASWFLGALAQAGPEAADAVPLLEPLATGDSFEALRAGGALLRIDGRKDVLRKLAKQLPRSPDEIAGILCAIGPRAAPVAGTLARVIDENFDEPDWDLMWALTDALAAIESPEPAAIRALRKSFSHESGRVKGSALNGLEKLGPAARAALPDLRAFLRKSSGESRRLVQRVILAIEQRPN